MKRSQLSPYMVFILIRLELRQLHANYRSFHAVSFIDTYSEQLSEEDRNSKFLSFTMNPEPVDTLYHVSLSSLSNVYALSFSPLPIQIKIVFLSLFHDLPASASVHRFQRHDLPNVSFIPTQSTASFIQTLKL